MPAQVLTPEELELQEASEDAVTEEDALFAEMAPVGDFSVRSMRILVKALNKVLPLFDLPVMEEYKEDVDSLPVDLTRVLSMISQSTLDASAREDIEAELQFSLDDITSDADLKVLSGKLESLSKNKDFKKFLKEPAPEAAEVVDATEDDATGEPTEAQIDELFSQRF